VCVLFFLWGFAYALVGSLSVQIQNLLGYPPSHTIALHAAYYGAYFVGPLLVGYWVLKSEGFKATFITGLAIFATGALSFWPSSVLRSYAGFVVSNFIIGLGVSCLEMAADLFIALAGPGEPCEARLNFAQGFNGIGAALSPIIAQVALFAGIDQLDLLRIQWCYFAVALFAVSLAIIFYYVPLFEAGDDDLEAAALQRLHNAGLC
jgi:fucose permease